MAVALILPRPAASAVISVSGACNLTAAILAANADTPVGGCPAGSGADVLELSGDVELTSVHNLTDGPNGLPSVTSKIEIRGPMVKIFRKSGSPKFRILHVAETGDLTLTTVEIEGGSAAAGTSSAVQGGGIFNRGRLLLVDSELSDNEAVAPGVSVPAEGGGLYNAPSGTAHLVGVTVNSNLAESASGRATGGGIYNRSGEMVITASTISNNIAQALGAFGGAEGGGVAAFPSVTISGSTFFNNTAFGMQREAEGGGVWAFSESLIENSTVSTNRALSPAGETSRGGGVYLIFSSSVRQVTFRSNTVSPRPPSEGAALYASSALNTVSGSIFSSSLGGHCDGSFEDDGGNLADNDSCAPTIASTLNGVDPALSSNGGPTETHALVPPTTASGAGGSCGFATDQRGAARVGPCDAGSFEDIGCAILELDFLTIFPTIMSTTCNTALLGPALIVESTGRLDVTAGALISITNDFAVMAGGELELGIDPSLLPP